MTKDKKPKIVAGKIFAAWCGHCKSLAPEWNKMKKNIQEKNKDGDVLFAEIEESQEGHKIPEINEKHVKKGKPLAVQGGYPTLFKIENEQVHYYGGARNAEEMETWFLNHDNNKNDSIVGGSKRRTKKRRSMQRRKTGKKKGCGCFDLGKWFR